jgi:thiol-disulfide isomerase/thioredoxin
MNKNMVLRVVFGLASLVVLQAGVARPSHLQGQETYPPYVKGKQLYATNDYRGKSGPKLVVQRWLTGSAPETKGKVILLDFWATWCPPCRETIPELNEWQKKFSKDLVVIGISNEEAAAVEKFMQITAMNYSVGIDTEDRTSKKVGVKGIPHALVLSPDGIVRWQGFPLDEKDPLTTEKLAQIIAASKKS